MAFKSAIPFLISICISYLLFFILLAKQFAETFSLFIKTFHDTLNSGMVKQEKNDAN